MSSLAVRLRLVRAEHRVRREVRVTVSPTASPTTHSRGQRTGVLTTWGTGQKRHFYS